jgi:hypothetical protein
MIDSYADIAKRGYAAVAKDALARKTDELARLRAEVAKCHSGLRRALVYLEHPEVAAIKFAGPASVLADQIREHLGGTVATGQAPPLRAQGCPRRDQQSNRRTHMTYERQPAPEDCCQDCGAPSEALARLRALNAELVAALKDALKALEHCALEPGMLAPLNNQQHYVAGNALPALRAALTKATGEPT